MQRCDYNHDRLWVQFPLKEMKHLIFPSDRFGKKAPALSSEAQDAMPQKFGRKWGTEVS